MIKAQSALRPPCRSRCGVLGGVPDQGVVAFDLAGEAGALPGTTGSLDVAAQGLRGVTVHAAAARRSSIAEAGICFTPTDRPWNRCMRT